MHPLHSVPIRYAHNPHFVRGDLALFEMTNHDRRKFYDQVPRYARDDNSNESVFVQEGRLRFEGDYAAEPTIASASISTSQSSSKSLQTTIVAAGRIS